MDDTALAKAGTLRLPRLVITGRGLAGKDLACQFLKRQTRLRYEQSTSAAAAQVVYERYMRDRYPDAQTCWEDRRNRRIEWARAIDEYNGPTCCQLYADMLATHDIINGIRRIVELEACRRHLLIDLVIWLERESAPPDASLDYGREACDIIIDNNGSKVDLYTRLLRLAKTWPGCVRREPLLPQ